MTTPSTPTSTMKEAERLVHDLMNKSVESYLGTAGRAAEKQRAAADALADLLAFIRSLVEAQPSAAVARVASYVTGDGSRRWALEPLSDAELYVGMPLYAAPSAVLPLKGEVPKMPHELTSWTCALATVSSVHGLQCPATGRCKDCPAMAAGEWAAAPSVEPHTCHQCGEQWSHCTCRFHRAASPVETEQPRGRTLPHPGSQEASDLLDAKLAEYNYPANPKNAARAGWEAANGWLAARPLPGGVPTGLSEREAFEAWALKQWPAIRLEHRSDGSYWDTAPDAPWEAWQARAALSAGAPSSLQGERK